MCGRYAFFSKVEEIREVFDIAEAVNYEARYNIAPTDPIPVVRFSRSRDQRILTTMRWGLVSRSSSAPASGPTPFNARAETADRKHPFKFCFQERRCLVPANGFYEWQEHPGYKQPMYIQMADERPFAFAGLWDLWKPRDDPEGQPLVSCTVLTTTPNRLVEPIHDRMPVIIGPEDYAAWLDPENQSVPDLQELLKPCAADLMMATPVSRRVGSVRNDDPDLIRPTDTPEGLFSG